MKDDNLKEKTARGSMITGGITMILRPLNIFASFLLMRLLGPADFGIVVLAMILLNTSNLFSGLGLGSAIIQSPHEKKKIAFPAFAITMTFATFLFLLVYTNLPVFARLLGDEEVVPILRWLTFLLLINTANTVPSSLMRKGLMFGRVGIASMLYQVSYTAISLTLAFLDFGMWSLVYAQISSSIIRTVAYFWLSPGWDWLIPRRWERAIVTNLLRFGLQNMWSGLLSYFHTHWDDWLVGRVLGKEALGFYAKAYDLSNNTIKQISDNVIGMVFFPSYAKIQNDPDRLMRAYLKSVRLVLLIVVPLSLGVFSVAPEMVRVLWGSEWVPMIPVLQIYSLMLLSRPISTNTAPLFLATGKPNFNTRAAFVLLSIMVPLALLLLDQGIIGVSIAVVISHYVGAAYNLHQVNTFLPGSGKLTLKALVSPLVAGVMMMTAVFVVKVPIQQLVGGQYNFPGLFLLIGVGGVFYLPLTYLTQKDLITEIWNMAFSIIGRRFAFFRNLKRREAA